MQSNTDFFAVNVDRKHIEVTKHREDVQSVDTGLEQRQ